MRMKSSKTKVSGCSRARKARLGESRHKIPGDVRLCRHVVVGFDGTRLDGKKPYVPFFAAIFSLPLHAKKPILNECSLTSNPTETYADENRFDELYSG